MNNDKTCRRIKTRTTIYKIVSNFFISFTNIGGVPTVKISSVWTTSSRGQAWLARRHIQMWTPPQDLTLLIGFNQSDEVTLLCFPDNYNIDLFMSTVNQYLTYISLNYALPHSPSLTEMLVTLYDEWPLYWVNQSYKNKKVAIDL